MSFAYLRAERSVYEYWSLQTFNEPTLQLPLTSTQLDTIQLDLTKATTDFKNQLASSNFQNCVPYAQFKATHTTHPMTLQQLASQGKAQIRTNIAADTGYYRVYMLDVRAYLVMQPGVLTADRTRVSLSVTKMGTSSVRAEDGSIHTFTHPMQPYQFDYFAQNIGGEDAYCPQDFPGPNNCDRINLTPFGVWEVGLVSPTTFNFSAVQSVVFEWELYFNQPSDGSARHTPMFDGGSPDDVLAFSGIVKFLGHAAY